MSGKAVKRPVAGMKPPAGSEEYDPQRAIVTGHSDPNSAEAQARTKRMRQRNWALFILLWAMVALFFAITVAKMS